MCFKFLSKKNVRERWTGQDYSSWTTLPATFVFVNKKLADPLTLEMIAMSIFILRIIYTLFNVKPILCPF